MNHTFGSNGYRSPEQKELMKGIPIIPCIIPTGCWCKRTPTNLRDHEFDENMEGIHSNVCPGTKKIHQVKLFVEEKHYVIIAKHQYMDVLVIIMKEVKLAILKKMGQKQN